MHSGESTRLLETLAEPQEMQRMNADYLAELHEEFGVEMDLLVGKGALERPYGQKPLTAAEAFYEDKLEGTTSQDFMEVNRTTMNLWLLDKVMQGDEQAVTACQPDAVKLVGEPFERLRNFTQETLSTPEKYHTARVVLMIADMGKSKQVADRMHELTGQTYADHDRLLVDVLKHPVGVAEMMPSFLTLDEETQENVIKMLNTGFHLPQFMQGENLPAHLVPFQELDTEWQDLSNLVSIYDIAGAAGDSIQNGSITLNRNTFTSFEQARDALQALPEHAGFTPEQRAVNSYGMYLQSLGDMLGLDTAQPEDRALARLARMNRAHAGSAPLIDDMRDVIDNKLGSLTKQTLLRFLNYTGFEPGALWQEYAPALYNEALKSMSRAGIDKKDILASALTNLARIDAETRSQLDMREATQPMNVVIGDIVRAAETNPRLLLNGSIVVRSINSHEAVATIEPPAPLDLEALPELAHLGDHLPPNWQPDETMYVGFGGGADPISSAIVANLLDDRNAPVVSVWGSERALPTAATQLSERVFVISPESDMQGMRNFEGTVAAMGLRSYLLLQERPFKHIDQDLALIAAHAGGITRIAGVDTGGDVMQPILSDKILTSRDHTTLVGIAKAGEHIGAQSSTSYVLAPGIDSPVNVSDILRQADAARYDLRKQASRIIELCMTHGLPSDNPQRYSMTLPMLLKAVQGISGIEELPIPAKEALRVHRPWPALKIIMPHMSQALIMSNQKHLQAVGLEA